MGFFLILSCFRLESASVLLASLTAAVREEWALSYKDTNDLRPCASLLFLLYLLIEVFVREQIELAGNFGNGVGVCLPYMAWS